MKKTSDYIIKAFAYIVLTVGALSMLLPFLWMLSTSLKSEAEAFIFPPQPFGDKVLWTNYLKISDRFNFANYFKNSIFVAVWVVFFQLLTSAMAGFFLRGFISGSVTSCFCSTLQP
jgi:multiple sugar transport system permease protein